MNFQDWSGRSREVKFVADEESLLISKFQTTVFTGQNGSHKSTLLRELVAALTVPGNETSIRLLLANEGSAHVVCTSGSVADRFPSKEKPGGGSTVFDVPNYVYLGQRVGPNLLSKKRPLQTLLTFALDPEKKDRFGWSFYEQAHKFAGIKPDVKFELLLNRHNLKEDRGIKEMIQGWGESLSPRQRTPTGMSAAVVRWLLEEFNEDDFAALDKLMAKKGRKISLQLGGKGAVSELASNTVLRLGLLTDLIGLSDVRVQSQNNSAEFSAFDLSSGEYHMYSSILGLGFGIERSSVVLIDEPENSLHPQWQQEFMNSVLGICSQSLEHGHLVICTHSALIVSAAQEGSSIVDLSNENSLIDTTAFGASSDEVLLSQFGIGSSRNRVVVDIVQRAVSLVERGDFDHPDFKAMTQELVSVRSKLRSDDPLADVIDALLTED